MEAGYSSVFLYRILNLTGGVTVFGQVFLVEQSQETKTIQKKRLSCASDDEGKVLVSHKLLINQLKLDLENIRVSNHTCLFID